MKPELERFTRRIETIRGGWIRLVDVMGGDTRIANTARIATGAESKAERNRRLIRYLFRNDPPHMGPFEFGEIHLEVRVPEYVWAQWKRYRAASINQRSMRAQGTSLGCYVAEEWRLQTDRNKMGSGGLASEADRLRARTIEGDVQRHSLEAYSALIEAGIAKERARKILTQDMWIEANWKVDLRNLMNFLYQRLDEHAQEEIRVYAEAIAEIVKVWAPAVWEAFVDYQLESKRLSRLDLIALRRVLKGASPEEAVKGLGMVKSERGEFVAWIGGLLEDGPGEGDVEGSGEVIRGGFSPRTGGLSLTKGSSAFTLTIF